ncbi:hypothetical protein [Candidatus Nanopusillus massiliensis]|nr:hypothetical protein [Candidatus Nanopusillus massiliensis]
MVLIDIKIKYFLEQDQIRYVKFLIDTYDLFYVEDPLYEEDF